ncbi:MAG: DUF1730 domain-containing protein [Eubacteriaceae bacterium]|nr:DUF1730 domain-containing protein [Eubacteriaceae bacterium]
MNGSSYETVAQLCGIDQVAKCDLGLLRSLSSHFEDLGDGQIAFSDKRPALKTDYLALWPNAKSIAAFLVSYGSEMPRPLGNFGQVARFARGEDYHIVVKERISKFLSLWDGAKGIDAKIFVDTSPLSERAVAYSAGSGFIGKNRMLINEKLGSFCYIGIALFDADINMPILDPSRASCMDCCNCLKACPTGALGQAHLDYKKCISYATQALDADNIDTQGYIWGCDLCNLACPYNNPLPLAQDNSVFIGSVDSAFLDIEWVLNASKEEFDSRFGNTALAWRGLGQLQANAKRIAKNTGGFASKS